MATNTTTTNTNTNTFQVGQHLACRSFGDHECIFHWEVLARTAKTMTILGWDGRTRRVGIKVDDAGEWALPDGRHSLAPVARPDRTMETV